MITNVSEFVKYTFIRLFGRGVDEVVTHGHTLWRRFGNHESKIISIDGGPWMESMAAQRKFARMIRADRKAEADFEKRANQYDLSAPGQEPTEEPGA